MARKSQSQRGIITWPGDSGAVTDPTPLSGRLFETSFTTLDDVMGYNAVSLRLNLSLKKRR